MKVYITKYALTVGILEADAQETSDLNGITVNGSCVNAYYYGKDWHNTLEDAIAQAEKMRAAKLKSIEKQTANIKMLDFTVVKQN